ncbi:hypothetical protein PR048_004844 [Dryococelus australis]|uniref:Uncharacterized protein n=1 Tax=Dryococelus australis TaxID=614101 RepID=A0ABQ9I6J4_9NEOP|nr:hypothetical protein PR048_004844 [Dryococelus australis]
MAPRSLNLKPLDFSLWRLSKVSGVSNTSTDSFRTKRDNFTRDDAIRQPATRELYIVCMRKVNMRDFCLILYIIANAKLNRLFTIVEMN